MYTTLSIVGRMEAAAFIFFVGFFGFVVLTILSGIFIEKALVAAQPDHETMLLEQRRNENQDAKELKDLITQMELSNADTMTLEEFERSATDTGVQAFFNQSG